MQYKNIFYAIIPLIENQISSLQNKNLILDNVLFGHWLRLSVFFGVSENEWQKMDYYLPEILIAVRKYLSEALSKR